ncbi:Disks large -like protein 1 Synapse-associated protein 97A [Channa argus]|uniref:Disks large-like protein 1 Synapse-associated protein 97A n=1 Tax=Channa argus TaxID=215402 RepID=A0A6G1PK05_CHAAH|nr:Disks large -like protein 1 Synapse-associated protein 97A [Channa argus]
MEVARELRDEGTLGRDGGTLGREGGTLGRDGGTLGREGGTLGRKGGTLGRDGGTLGRDGGTLGRDGGTMGRDGGTLGRDGGTWRREGVGFGTMERERERSLGRDGSLGRRCDLRGAELVQVAERQLSHIQHVHGYVTHTHITPAQEVIKAAIRGDSVVSHHKFKVCPWEKFRQS